MRRRVVRPSMESYVEATSLIERAHHEYLCLIGEKLEFIGANDLNSVQAVILLHIGDAKIAINEVRTKGNYFGSNLSYIIKRLVENGYLKRERSSHDFRSVDIWLTEKGRSFYDQMVDLRGGIFPKHPSHGRLERAVLTLNQLEQFWIDRQLDR